MTLTKTNDRIHILDVLRGFAIVSIMLLHNIEHFDVYFFPDSLPKWMVAMDQIIWDSMFFMFGGKSYAIFALLFGVTFAIQLMSQQRKSKGFSARFAWRMLLLLAFGIVNSAFFQGDILTIYAVLGLLLIPLTKLNDRLILIIASFLMFLPVELWRLIYAIQNPLEVINDPVSWTYFGKMFEYIGNDSVLGTLAGNLTNGKTAVLLWNWENGRYFTILGLFLYGYLLGKHELFRWTERSSRFWKKALVISLVAFVPLLVLQKNLDVLISSDIIRRSVSTIETAWTNFAFMIVIVSGLTILFQKEFFQKKLMYFSSFGRMSLTNYMVQSIFGAFIYYGFGLGLYKYTGATYGIVIGLILTVAMGKFCSWWAKHHKQGPVETLWHKATWLGSKK